MRHNVKGRKLGRTTEHRLAMFSNQLSSLVAHGRITTTLARAKELRPLAERMITKGKRGDIAARRQVRRWIDNRVLVRKLFDDVAPRFQERPGGYLRIVKLGPRKGDGAEMAILEMVDFELEAKSKKQAPAAEAKAKKQAKEEGEEPEESGPDAEAPAKPKARRKKATAKP